MRGLRLGAVGCAASAALLGVAGCGGERQDKAGPSGSFRLEVVDASFPKQQDISRRAKMRIRVRNADSRAVPAVSVVVATQPGKSGGAAQAFGSDIADPAVAAASRPIWVVDRPPRGGDTAVTNTWSLGRLAPGQTKEFEWQVTPVKAGSYTVDYSALPDLTGKARVSGDRASGTFRVTVSDVPPDARVGDDGQVIETPGKG